MQKEKFVRLDTERGSTMLEYALLATLVALASVSSVTSIGQHAANTFKWVHEAIQSANNMVVAGNSVNGGNSVDPGGSDETDDRGVIFIPTSAGD